MKKIMIAAAVVGAFAGTAQAQTSVTLYGIADLNLRFDRTSNGTFRSLGGGDLAPSRWGLRGTEDLGGGLKAVFNFEAAINNDTGINGAGLADGFQRVSVVGLQGNFGHVRGGVDYTPYFRSWSSNVLSATLGSPYGGKTPATAGGSTRMANAIYYDSPNMGGLIFRGAYQMGESAAAATKNGSNAYSLAVNYANGPIGVGLAHQNNKNAAATSVTKSSVISASYDFKVVKLHAAHNVSKSTGAVINQANSTIGVSAPMGKWSFFGYIARYNDKTVANADAKFFSLGTQYNLSPRTAWYATYGHLDNNAASAMHMGGLQAGNVAVGSNPSAFTTGMRHTF